MNSLLRTASVPSSAVGIRAPIYNLVYFSRACAAMDAAAIDRIVEVSQRNNPALGITGLLVFGGGVFFQWLEGPRDSVTGLMAKLPSDARHQDIVILSASEDSHVRLFPQWAMELVNTTDIRTVLLEALETTEDLHNAEALVRLLEQLDSGSVPGL